MIYFIIWVLCTLIGMIIGVIIRKKINVSKKVNKIVILIFYIIPLPVYMVLINFNNISQYDQRAIPVYFFTTGIGWALSSLLVKNINKE